MSPSIYGSSSSFGDLVSFSFFIICLCSLIRLSCEDNIYDASALCLLACTNVGITNGATLPFIILWPLASVLSYSFLAPNPKVPPSSTLPFLFRTLLGNFATTFLMFSNATCISSLVLLTLVYGFYRLSFLWKQHIFKNLCQNQG